MALGRRCAMGCADWPNKPIYDKCPVCGEATELLTDSEPLDDDVAEKLLLAAQFNEYYEKRCAHLGIPSDGPLPKAYELSLPAPQSLVG